MNSRAASSQIPSISPDQCTDAHMTATTMPPWQALAPRRTPSLVHRRGRVALHTGLGVPLVLFCTSSTEHLLYLQYIDLRPKIWGSSLVPCVWPSIQGPPTRDPKRRMGNPPARRLVPSAGWQHCQSVRLTERAHPPRRRENYSVSTDRTLLHAATAQGSDPGSRSQRAHPHRGLVEPLISRDHLDNEAGLQRGVKRKSVLGG
ncbi:hypothetical protein QBC39DRAFT_70760 [Podospora conica]|nr:hypothetical protein QBC39DRAFT_70760 [Schizothecium conicum]